MTKHIHGGDVYKYDHCLDFSANCNPLGTPQSVKQAIIDSVEDLSDYPRVGCGPYRFFTESKCVTTRWFDEEEMKKTEVSTWDGTI